MINFTIKNQDVLVGGLTFQIAHKFKDCASSELNLSIVDFKNSIVITEDAFSLIESCFASEFPVDNKHYIHYHHGMHLHNIESIESIINKLLSKKSMFEQDGISMEKYRWFTEDEVRYLNTNKILIYNFIDDVIHYLQNSVTEIGSKGVYVLGI